MDVTVEAIMFNHELATGAFNIRRNEKKRVLIPEWKRGRSTKPEDSPAAYALNKVKNLSFIIKAKFSCSDSSLTKLKVKALLEEFVPGQGPDLKESQSSNTSPKVLGETGETEVVFKGGQSEYEILTLNDSRIFESGVAVRDITWRWQHSPTTPSNQWTDFGLTHHRIYSTVRRPTCPWKPDSSTASDTQVPWTDVLDHACRWAATTTQVDDAATAITRRITDLGHDGLLHYDDPNSGAVNFTYETPFMFDCSDFLRLLAGRKNSQGRKVNCDDCAAIVVTFTNILGCDLNEGQMGIPAFLTKRHLRIGLPALFGGQFSHHTVGWKDACLEYNRLFDACLQLNSVNNPNADPRWFVPANILFGDSNQDEYRSRLALEPEDCTPEGKPRRRRIGHPKIRRGSRSRFSNLSKANPFISAAILKKRLLDWRLADFRFIETDDALYFLQSFWKHKISENASLGIDAYECDSPERALKLMNIVLSTFQLTDIRERRTEFGDVGFANSARYAIVFVRGRFVFRFRNTGVRPVACDDFARFVDELILREY